jgi:hypothetical protein
MKTRRFLPLLAGGLLGLTGCPDEPCNALPPFGASGAQSGVIMVGEQVRLFVSPQIQPNCDGEIDSLPSSFSAEVYGPDNQPVPHQATFGTPSSTTGTIRFTAEKIGRHHVFAAFDPVGGIQQFDLHAAVDRSAEAVLHPFPRSCVSLERTRRGAWVCDTDFVRGELTVRQFTGGRLAVAGDTVWVVSNDVIQRFVDTGTDLVLTGSTPAHGSIEFLLPTENELLVLHALTLERVSFNGTTLAYAGSAPWSPGISPFNTEGPQGVLLRVGDKVAVVTRRARSSLEDLSELCSYQLEGTGIVRTSESCQTFSTRLIGYEPNALWTGEASTFSNSVSDVRRMEWTGTQLVEQAAFPLGTSLGLSTRIYMHRQSVVPVIIAPPTPSSPRSRPVVLVYSTERRSFALEYLDAEIQAPLASTTLIWGLPLGATTGSAIRVRVRPPAP